MLLSATHPVFLIIDHALTGNADLHLMPSVRPTTFVIAHVCTMCLPPLPTVEDLPVLTKGSVNKIRLEIRGRELEQ